MRSADPAVPRAPGEPFAALVLLVAAGAIGLQAGGDAFACGDKFVRVGRGARYQRGYVALHPASIVVYMGSGATASGTLKGMEPALKAAGHKVVTVKADALAATLTRREARPRARRLRRRVADRLRGQGGAQRARAAAGHEEADPDAFAEATKEWTCVVGDPGDKYEVLTSIDKVLEKRK